MKLYYNLIILIFSASIAQSQAQLFQTNNYYPQINSAKKVSSGDINGDGFADLLVLADHQESLLIYLNDQNNQFYLAKNQLNIDAVQAALLADYDGDGDLDIRLTSNIDDAQELERVFRNNGQGEFEGITYQVFYNQDELNKVDYISGDLNNDGVQDYIRMAQTLDNELLSLYVYVNGVMSEPSIESLTNPHLADFNGDGYLDIWSLASGLKIYLNDGQGFFDGDSTVEINQTIIGLSNDSTILADIDKDGDTDIQTFSTDLSLPRYLNNGDGTFTRISGVPFLLGVPGIQTGVFLDIDNDQDLDLWYADNTDINSEIVLTDEEGGLDYQTGRVTLNENQIQALVTDDFDNDGHVDVVSVGSKGIRLWQQLTMGEFTLSEQNSVNQHWGQSQVVDLTDMNNDGQLDLVATGKSGVRVAIGNGQGGFSNLITYHGESVFRSHAADFNGDGFADVAVIRFNGDVELLFNDQNNGLQNQALSIESNQAYNISSGDFDADGDLDLIVQEYLGSIHVVTNQGNNQLEKTQTIEGGFRLAELIDLNQNGDVVLVAKNVFSTFAESTVGVIEYNYNGSSFNKTRSIEIPSLFRKNMVFLDHDGDGDLDILTNKFAADGFVLVLNKDSSFEASSLVFSGGLPSQAADFNQDGHIDLVNDSGEIYLKTNGGYESINNSPDAFSINPFIIGDFDHDSDLDLVLSEVNSGLSTQMNTTIDLDFSGQWYNPQQDGHGLQLEHIVANGIPKVVLSWYVYNNGEQMWLTGLGDIQGNSSNIQAYITSGPDFGNNYDVNDYNSEPWGTVTLTMTEKNRIDLNWNGSLMGFSQGEMQMERFVVIKPVTKKLQTINSCHSGSWYDPSTNGQGFMIQTIDVGGTDKMVMTWYTYLNGQQYWLTGLGTINGNKATIDVQSTTGAEFPPVFEASDVQRIDWGQIDFELISNNQARVSWRSILNDFPDGEMIVGRLTSIDRFLCH